VKILIIEDEKNLSDSIKEYLGKSGFLCETAFSWVEADEKISLYEYDCALVDITLPGGNGLDLLQKIKIQMPKTSIIVISARHSIDDKLKGFDLGADDYLPKPFHLSELNGKNPVCGSARAFCRAKFSHL
jgi:DNA-binding response OmpR family regulator